MARGFVSNITNDDACWHGRSMIDRTHNDQGAKVSAIIDDALADLFLLEGVEGRDEAAVLMACLATLRIEDNEKRREVEQYAAQLVWDVDDTGGGDAPRRNHKS